MKGNIKSTLAILGGPKAVQAARGGKWNKTDANVKKAVMKLIDAGVVSITDGSGVIGEFENAFAKMAGTRYALTMNSGTSTLHSAYFAVGVGPGSEVIAPTYTWHATITPILHCAATPVFCDIDPKTLTASPEDIERKITRRTRAICVVHVWGNVCDMDKICAIAKRHKIALIEDGSHAHGACWKGRKVGSIGDIGCFSMQGAKAVSGGEAGVATTNNPEFVDRMILLGHFGRQKTGENKAINRIGDMSLGTKYRPHPWAIAMANEELKKLPLLNKLRTRNYKILNDTLRGCSGIELIEPLKGAERGGYLEFKFLLSHDVLKTVSRERIVQAMQAEGAPVVVDRYSNYNYTYGLLHTAPLFTDFDRHSIGGCFYDPTLTREEEARHCRPPSLPVAEDVSGRLISTDAFIDVNPKWVREVAMGMRKVLEQVDKISKAG